MRGLTTTGWRGSCAESSRESLHLFSVFPAGAVTSLSKAKALRCQAMTVAGCTICRHRRQPDQNRDNRTPITRGRSAEGASDAAHSLGEQPVGVEGREFPSAVRRGSEN